MALQGPSVMKEVLCRVQVAGHLYGVAAALEHIILLYLELRQLVEGRQPRWPIAECFPAAGIVANMVMIIVY